MKSGKSDKSPGTLACAFRASLPVMVGYLMMGFGMGLLAQSKGYPWYVVLAMSVLLYAGAMQYLAVELFTAGTSLPEIALITLFVQCRHAFYGLSLLERYRDQWKNKPYMIHALTDEAYALHTGTAPPPGVPVASYDFCVAILCHIYWICGTMLGVVLGSVLPFDFTGIDFVLTALFLSICVDQWRAAASKLPSVVSAAICFAMLLIFGPDNFLLPSLLGIIAALLILRKPIDAKRPKVS